MGPKTQIGRFILATKYAQHASENWYDVCNRVAAATTDGSEDFHTLRDMMGAMRFIPAGRNLASLGTSRQVASDNCFVSGTLKDSFTEGEGSIMQRAAEAAETLRLGGGIGYDFSPLRPRGSLVSRTGSNSTGPISFMQIFHAVCGAVAAAGHRRGAQMAVLRCDHPDIEEFVLAKHKEDVLTTFNLSVGITDAFMQAVEEDEDWELKWGGAVYKTIRARDLWELIMRGTWDWAEPGVLFVDRINQMNNLGYYEHIAATNPCGEQPLPPHGACLLGSFNCTQYVEKHGDSWGFNFELLRQDIPHVVKAMDNIVDRAIYPLEEQQVEAFETRRMGLGVLGMANAVEALGFEYASEGYIYTMQQILKTIRDCSYAASVQLARERGAFARFTPDYLKRPFIRSLPQGIQEGIAQHGIRNSHLTSIAPTGTISLLCDNTSGGIEPVFQHEVERTIDMGDGGKTYTLRDHGVEFFGVRGRTADRVSPQEHISVLCAAQEFVDSAVSKTVNVPSTTSWEDFKELYFQAWRSGAKGCATYTTGGKKKAVLRAKDEPSEQSDEPEEELRSCPMGGCDN